MSQAVSSRIQRGTVAATTATVAAYAVQFIGGRANPAWFIVWMDEERRLWEPPRLLRDAPIKPYLGRLGSGLTLNVQNAVRDYKAQRTGPASYVVVHWLADAPREIPADDMQIVRRFVSGKSLDIEVETPEILASDRAWQFPWDMVFLDDLVCLWSDGTFKSAIGKGGAA